MGPGVRRDDDHSGSRALRLHRLHLFQSSAISSSVANLPRLTCSRPSSTAARCSSGTVNTAPAEVSSSSAFATSALRSVLRHCERSEAIQSQARKTGLLRFARNDEKILPQMLPEKLRRPAPGQFGGLAVVHGHALLVD